MLGEHSRINNNVFLRKSLRPRQEPRAMGQNQYKSMEMIGSEPKGNMEYVDIPRRCLPVALPSPTVRAPIHKWYYIYIVLQASVALAPDLIE
jgi:hypothetical protein